MGWFTRICSWVGWVGGWRPVVQLWFCAAPPEVQFQAPQVQVPEAHVADFGAWLTPAAQSSELAGEGRGGSRAQE